MVYSSKDGSVIKRAYIEKDALGDAPPNKLQAVISQCSGDGLAAADLQNCVHQGFQFEALVDGYGQVLALQNLGGIAGLRVIVSASPTAKDVRNSACGWVIVVNSFRVTQRGRLGCGPRLP